MKMHDLFKFKTLIAQAIATDYTNLLLQAWYLVDGK